MEREGERHIPVVYSVRTVSCESNHLSFQSFSINKTEKEDEKGCWKAVMNHSAIAMMRYNKDNMIAAHSVIQYMMFLMLHIYVDYYSVCHTLIGPNISNKHPTWVIYILGVPTMISTHYVG